MPSVFDALPPLEHPANIWIGYSQPVPSELLTAKPAVSDPTVTPPIQAARVVKLEKSSLSLKQIITLALALYGTKVIGSFVLSQIFSTLILLATLSGLTLGGAAILLAYLWFECLKPALEKGAESLGISGKKSEDPAPVLLSPEEANRVLD